MNGSTKIKQIVVSTVMAVGMTFSLAAGGQQDIAPAGTNDALMMEYQDIQDITLDGISSYSIIEGDTFSLEIKGDKAFVEAVSAENRNGYLKVISDTSGPVEVVVTTPSIESLNISGHSAGTITGYDLDSALAIYISDESALDIKGILTAPTLSLFASESNLKGDVDTLFMSLDVHGSSNVSLKGSADTLRAELVSNSSTVLDGLSVQKANIQANNSAVLTADLPGVSNVSIDTHANSSVELAMDGILSADVFGDSALTYSGDVTWAGRHVADGEDDDAYIRMN